MVSKLKIDQQSYGGKFFRPTPQIFVDNSLQMTLCLTAWGNQGIINIVAENVKNMMLNAKGDSEATFAFPRKDSLSRLGNVLRMAIIFASEQVNKQFNKTEYNTGFEICAGFLQGPIWTYVCCGQPSLILSRQGNGNIPLHHSLDLNFKFPGTSQSHPLPNNILGLGQNPPIHFGSLRLLPSDRILMISRSYLPSDFFNLSQQTDRLKICQLLATESPDMPFWVGEIKLPRIQKIAG